MMQGINISNLQAKVLIEKNEDRPDADCPSSLEVISLSEDRLYFTKAINPKYFNHFSKITIFIKCAGKWKTYNLSEFWPEKDEKEFGKVDCLVFKMNNQSEAQKFKYDLEAARC